MSEYDPKPRQALPLNYASPTAKQKASAGFGLGCFGSVSLLIGLPILFGCIANDLSYVGYGLIFAVLVLIPWVIVSFVNEKRAFARGLLCGPLAVVCLLMLLIGICRGK